MKIFPAIDILDGKCVRLYKGRFDEVSVYSNNPVEMAKKLAFDGAQNLHIVDLNGAREGRAVNQNEILQISKNFDGKIEVGGGIRTYEAAAEYLDGGVDRVILGTIALEEPKLLRELLCGYGKGRIVVSLDISDGKLAVRGWEEFSERGLKEVLESLREIGVENLIITDVSKDGTLEGPGLELIGDVCDRGFKVTAAGGVSSVSDLRRLEAVGCDGAIIGKALYEGRVGLGDFVENNLCKRVIPCMDIAEGRVVKGTYFKNLKDAGDPVELAKLYSDAGADELVFLDINATFEGRDTLLDLVSRVARAVNIPFTVGGGARNLSDVSALLEAGADKVSIGSAAVKDPEFVRALAEKFGRQCIVISLDCSWNDSKGENAGFWELYIAGGREATGIDVREFAKKMELLGAGELLVNSLDRDGTRKGYDIDLLRTVSDIVSIPVIASSGAGCLEDFSEAFRLGGVDAVLAASLFHYNELTVEQLKRFLDSKNIKVRI